FLTRNEYNEVKRNPTSEALREQFGKAYIIPEGGYGPLGTQGAAEILRTTDVENYTHIVSAIGTGTTVAGILLAIRSHQQVIGISSMKNNLGLKDAIQCLTDKPLPARF